MDEGNPTIKKFQTNYPEAEIWETNRSNDSRNIADSELSVADENVRDLTLRIEESKSIAKARIQAFEKQKMAKTKSKDQESSSGNSLCAKVMKELETIKRELRKLKLDMALVLEEKRRAEKETEFSLSKTESYSSSVKALREEIEEINEEHVVVELARIEAVKEYEEIEAQKREKAEKYSDLNKEAQKKKQEIQESKEMETKLAITISDINMLQSELNQIKEMEKGSEKNDVLINEFEAAKKELALIKEESFQFMASMDVVRNEIRHIAEEKSRLKKKDEKTETIIQNLNYKLLRAKAKLESSNKAQDKAKSIVSNLTVTLENLESEIEAANKELSSISEETAFTKAEVDRIETEIDSGEEKLQGVLQELKAVKSLEAEALENLEALIENTVRNRASASRASSRITISKFEYEYLTGNAVMAKEIADKKVAAAQAWIEALKASEKEILIKTEILRREMKVEGEEREVRKMPEEELFEMATKKSNRNFKMTPMRRAKARKSVSPVVRIVNTPRSKSLTVKRRKKVMPNLAKFFSGKSPEGNI